MKGSRENIINAYKQMLAEVEKVNDLENVIGKALLVRQCFCDYKGHVDTLENNAESRREDYTYFIDSIIKESAAGILLTLNYIKRNDEECYEELGGAMKKSSCWEEYIRQEYEDAMEKNQKGEKSLYSFDAVMLFLKMVLCEETIELEQEIKGYIKEILSKYDSSTILKCIDLLVIDGDNNGRLPRGEGIFALKENTVVHELEYDTKMAIYFYLQPLLGEQQIKKYAKLLITDIIKLKEHSKIRLVQAIEQLLENSRFSEVQNLLTESKQLYDIIKEQQAKTLGAEETQLEDNIKEHCMMTFMLDRDKPERMMYYYYTKDNPYREEVDLETLECWWKNMQSLSFLKESSIHWARWTYELEKMIERLSGKSKNPITSEQHFWDEYKEILENMPLYPYDETDYIKKMCEKQSEIFCVFLRNRWDCKALIKALGENNLLSYEKDSYYNSWPLAVIFRAEGYKEEIEGFYEKYTTPEEMIEIYMNTSLHFFYRIQDLMSCINTMDYDKEALKAVLEKYPIRARVLACYQDVRARGKVKLLFYTINTGCYNQDLLTYTGADEKKNQTAKFLINCEETWCESNKQQIWHWPEPPFDCTCYLTIPAQDMGALEEISILDKGIANNIIVTDSKKEGRKLDKKAEIDKFIEWMDLIIKDKIVYFPFYLMGDAKEDYREQLKSAEIVSENEEEPYEEEEDEDVSVDNTIFPKKYKKEMLCAFKPSQVNQNEEEEYTKNVNVELGEKVAKKILEVYVALCEESEKVQKFMTMLNKGSIDAINEFHYTATGRSNGGILNGEYRVTYNPELKKEAWEALNALCKSSLPAQIIGDIYMNTYLKQYISIVQFNKTMGYYKKNLPFSKFVAAEYKNENQNDYTFCVQLVKDATEDNPVLEFELYPPYEEKPKMEKVTENLKWVFKLQYPNGKKKQVDVKKFLDKFGVGRATIEKYTEVKGKDGKPIYYEVELKRIMPCYNSNKTWSDIIRDFRDFKKKTNLSDIAKRGNMLKKYLGDMNYFHEDRLEMITKYMIDSFYKYQFERTRCEQLLAVFDSNNPYYAKDVKDYLSFDEKKKENMRICVDKLLRKNAPYIDLHTDFDIFKVYAKSCLRVYVEVDDFLMGLAEIRCSETDKEEYLESLKVRMYRLCKKNNIPWME